MKLNNHGWGMRDMIIYTCILLFFLLVAIYFIHLLYSELEKSLKSSNDNVVNVFDDKNKDEDLEDEKEIDYDFYYDYEEKMNEAAKQYVLDNNIILNTNIKMIELDTLVKEGYLDELRDSVDDTICSGYSNVWDEEDSLEVSSYINCKNYVTEGY